MKYSAPISIYSKIASTSHISDTLQYISERKPIFILLVVLYHTSVAATVAKYESEFLKLVIGQSTKDAEHERQIKQKELKTLLARDKELDVLFEKIYEDNAMGRLSDERFGKLSVKYDAEQKELNKQITELQAELDSDKNKSISTDDFMAIVRKYTRARKLTPRMLNELIEKIEVYQAEIIDGKKVQRLKIYYNCIGSIQIPDLDLIPDNAVTLNTRQGVDINFAGAMA